MGSGVMQSFGHIMTSADDPTFGHHDSPDGNLSFIEGSVGFSQSLSHEFLIDVHHSPGTKKAGLLEDLPKESNDDYHLSSDDTVSFLRP